MRRLPLLLSVCALALAVVCSNPDRIRTPAAADSLAAVPPARVDSGSFTADDFRRLAWLHGRWEGFTPEGDRYYAQYQMLDDSTIIMHAFGDARFTAANDSARLTLRHGVVAREGPGGRWVATRLDSAGVDFAPVRIAGNYMTLARESATAWNTTLRWTDRDGRPQSRLYALHKYGR